MKYTECHNEIDIGSDNSRTSPISDKELESAENSNKNISNSLNMIYTFPANDLTITSFTNEKDIQSSILNDCNL